jgi:hypothetical protein
MRRSSFFPGQTPDRERGSLERRFSPRGLGPLAEPHPRAAVAAQTRGPELAPAARVGLLVAIGLAQARRKRARVARRQERRDGALERVAPRKT